MDFVSRLKKFLEQKQIPITQFADNCRIPRPTVSQLLNGRNKKVSDEVITKIHEAYPELSVMWLMFGEGPMMADAKPGFTSPLPIDAVPPTEEPELSPEQLNFDVMYVSGEDPDQIRPAEPKKKPTTIDFPEALSGLFENNETREDEKPQPSPIGNRKISSIIVFFDDGKFQQFYPS